MSSCPSCPGLRSEVEDYAEYYTWWEELERVEEAQALVLVEVPWTG